MPYMVVTSLEYDVKGSAITVNLWKSTKTYHTLITYPNSYKVLHLGKKPGVLDKEAPPMNYVLLSLAK